MSHTFFELACSVVILFCTASLLDSWLEMRKVHSLIQQRLTEARLQQIQQHLTEARLQLNLLHAMHKNQATAAPGLFDGMERERLSEE